MAAPQLTRQGRTGTVRALCCTMGGVSSIQSLPLALGQAWLPHIMKLAVMARIYDNRGEAVPPHTLE